MHVDVGAWSGRSHPPGAVVVGYNGKEHSAAALAWGAAEAIRLDAPLLVLYAANYPGMTADPGPGLMHREPGALEAAEELAKEGISVEIVDPRTLRPMDTETIVGSVRKTHRAIVLEAGAGFAGMGSEIAAEIQEEAFDDLDAPIERVTGENAPMPYAKNLELLKTPSKAKIVAAIRRVCNR